ncbi:apical exonemal protein [Hepatocystis sp. ex Piliocolobus tephrosceles]|nr:apical exonemal protein [Hepatocystis sp. ex Piliocolobus tephrosceles]
MYEPGETSKRYIYTENDKYYNNVIESKEMHRSRNESRSQSSDNNSNTYTNENVLDYTKLYDLFKKKNKVTYYNKSPIHPYRYPITTHKIDFEDLKKELIKEEKRKNKQTDYINTFKDGSKFEKKQKKKKKEANIYKGDIKIYVPNGLQNGEICENGKPKKSLRQRIYDNEAIFYSDYIEQEAAKDYEWLFKKPYKIKRKDEGGKYYFYGKKLLMNEEEDIYRKYYNLDDEYFIKKLQLKKEMDKKQKKANTNNKIKIKEHIKSRNEYEQLSYDEKKYIQYVINKYEYTDIDVYDFYKKNKNIIKSNLSQTKKEELLFGKMPDIILPRKDKKLKSLPHSYVELYYLNTYANFIDSMFKCPYIYTAIDAELGKYWKTNDQELNKYIKTEKVTKPNKKDILYSVTKEQLEKSSNKLKNLFKEEEKKNEDKKNFKVTLKVDTKKNEPENKVICNGRYII